MPPLEQTDLIHRMLWWPRSSVNRYGQVKVLASSRTQLWCRWTDRRRDVLRPDGSIISIDATIATTRALTVGDIVWRGGLVDLPSNGLTGTGTGTVDGELPEEDLMQVTTENVANDLKGGETRYEYGLMKWGNAVPVE